MNTTRMDVQPFRSAPIVYPTLGRSIIDSSLTLGRTILVAGVGLALLIGVAMLIAVVLTAGVDVLGLSSASHY
jgi:hypothetical protein